MSATPTLNIAPTTGPGGEIVLKLSGCVDERADLQALQAVEAGATLVLDLGDIARINSVGVREWIRAMKTIPSNVQVWWDNVSTPMVAQLNMIANFHGHSRIRSFYAPYYCNACDLEQRFLLTMEKDLADGKAVAPAHECTKCGATLEFDDIEEDYLGGLLEASAQQ